MFKIFSSYNVIYRKLHYISFFITLYIQSVEKNFREIKISKNVIQKCSSIDFSKDPEQDLSKRRLWKGRASGGRRKGGGEEDCLNGEEWNRRKLAALEISNV